MIYFSYINYVDILGKQMLQINVCNYFLKEMMLMMLNYVTFFTDMVAGSSSMLIMETS